MFSQCWASRAERNDRQLKDKSEKERKKSKTRSKASWSVMSGQSMLCLKRKEKKERSVFSLQVQVISGQTSVRIVWHFDFCLQWIFFMGENRNKILFLSARIVQPGLMCVCHSGRSPWCVCVSTVQAMCWAAPQLAALHPDNCVKSRDPSSCRTCVRRQQKKEKKALKLMVNIWRVDSHVVPVKTLFPHQVLEITPF